MDDKYLEVSLDDIYDELINYNISLKELVSIYGFPSEKVLEKALKSYCRKFKIQLPKQIESPEEFFTEEEEGIYRLREEENVSLKKIADYYHMTTYAINKILKRFEKAKGSEEVEKTNSKKKSSSDFDIDSIIKDLLEGKSYGYVEKTYNISQTKLKKLLLNHPREKEIFEIKSRHRSSKKIIPKEEAIEAFLKHDYTKYSSTTIRKRLKEFFGDNYALILRGDEIGDQAKAFSELYEKGITCDEIAKLNNISIDTVKSRLTSHYKSLNLKRPKILSKQDFEKHMEEHPGSNVEKVIETFKDINILIPESYIQEYYRKIGEVDFRKVKTIVNREFAKMQDEGKKPNLVGPFEFANDVKVKGYNTKYQATALLYRVIIDNDLSSNIASELGDEDVLEALHILVDSDKNDKVNYLRNIQNNKIARLIYSLQNQTYYSDHEKDLND